MGKNRITFNDFKNRCDDRFGKGTFTFQEDEYVNMITKIHITCVKCGNVMFITPSDFLRRRGCTACTPISYLHCSMEEMFDRFHKTHGDKYDYSLITEYKGMDAKYLIICRRHGAFPQSAYTHIRGQGCPDCKAEKAKQILYGVGINDYDGRVKIKDELIPSYDCWVHMIKRCYDEIELRKRPSYRDCSVCDEWLHFSNFKKWFDDPTNGYIDGYQLEKDILVAGNRVYSPETCCFVPNLINAQIKSYKKRTNGLPQGVYKKKGTDKFYSVIAFNDKDTYLGSFETAEEAHAAYKQAKENNIHNIAEEMFKDGEITRRVYEALSNYKLVT